MEGAAACVEAAAPAKAAAGASAAHAAKGTTAEAAAPKAPAEEGAEEVPDVAHVKAAEATRRQPCAAPLQDKTQV